MCRTAMKYASLVTAMSIALVAHSQTPPSSTTPPAAAPRARGPSLALAVEAAQVAAATCTANGYKTTVLVTDSAGVPVVLLSGDGAIERTQSIAARKVATLLSYDASSADATSPARPDQPTGPPRQGALLLKVGSITIGIVAVSGAPGADKDEVCAQSAVDKIKDRLR